MHALCEIPLHPLLHLELHISHNILVGSTVIMLSLFFSKISIYEGLYHQSIFNKCNLVDPNPLFKKILILASVKLKHPYIKQKLFVNFIVCSIHLSHNE